MANVQLAVAGDETTQVILSVPGVQGPAGSNLPPSGTTHQLLYKQSNTNYDTAWKLITNDNVDAAAAIAGTKISPNFGSQNVLTTGTSTAASFIPSSSSVPTNGLYLPSANNVALSTNGTGRLFVDASGNVGVGASAPRSRIDLGSGVGGASQISWHEDASTAYGNIFVLRSSAATVIANGMRGSSTISDGFESTVSASFAKSAITIGTGSIRFFTDAASTVAYGTAVTPSERLRITSAGLVGIGTSSPNSLTEIRGTNAGAEVETLRLTNNSTTTGTSSSIIFNLSTVSQTSAKIAAIRTNSPISADTELAFSQLTNGVLTERLRITSAGNVGIGTNSPDTALHLASTSPVLRFENPTTTSTTGTSMGKIEWETRDASAPGVIGYIDVVDSNNFGTAFDMQLATGVSGAATTKVTIKADGKVGINTASPASALDVNGSIQTGWTTSGQQITVANGDTTNRQRLVLSMSGTDAVINATRTAGTVPNLTFAIDATERARIDSSGRLLIGAIGNFSTGANLQNANSNIAIGTYLNTSGCYEFVFLKSRGTTVGTESILNSGDLLGQVTFRGSDGVTQQAAATINARVDASPAYASTALVTGQTYRIVTVTSSDWSAIGGPNPASVGNVFTATGPSVTSLGTAILNAGNMPGRLIFSTTADGSVSPTERLRITSAGLVGIGTSAPSSTLDVFGPANGLQAEFNGSIDGRGLAISTAVINGVNNGLVNFNARGAGTDGTFTFSTDGNERARIDSSGRLGIGTSAPNTRLSVVGTATGLVNGAIRTNTTAATQSANSGLWLCGNQSTSHYNWLIASQFNVGGALEITPSTAVDGATFTTPTAVFTQTGRVGIGTTSPGGALEVNAAASTAPAIFKINTAEAARIDSSGRLLVGTSSARALEPFGITTNGTNTSHVFEGVQTGSGLVGIACVNNSDTSAVNGAYLLLGRTRGNAVSSNTLVQAGDNLGTIGFAGADGTDLRTKAAAIYAEVDGSPGADDMPGRIVLATTADGAASPTERMRIGSNGLVTIAGDTVKVATAKTPASATAAGTAGEICWDANYIYVCTATNTWKRTAIATW